jgi:hypothetical protein
MKRLDQNVRISTLTPLDRAPNKQTHLHLKSYKELNSFLQNADGGDEEVQAQPLTDPEAVDHSAVKVRAAKQETKLVLLTVHCK